MEERAGTEHNQKTSSKAKTGQITKVDILLSEGMVKLWQLRQTVATPDLKLLLALFTERFTVIIGAGPKPRLAMVNANILQVLKCRNII